MNLCTVVGFIGCWVVLIVTAKMGGSLSGFLDTHAFLIVVMGTTCAVILAVDPSDLKSLPKIIKRIIGGPPDYHAIVESLTKFAEIARRDGLLALETQVKDVQDPNFQKALQMVVDGSNSQDIENYFDTALELAEHEHEHGKKVIEFYEKWAPSFGLLGTLQGLICMLQNLSDPDMIAPSMGVAMVATFYGAGVAFMMGGPLANKLQRAFDNQHHKYLIIKDGVCAIQNGANPRVIEERLSVYLHH